MKDQINAYVKIALEGIAPVGFEEDLKLLNFCAIFYDFRNEISAINKHSNLKVNKAARELANSLQQHTMQFIQTLPAKPTKQQQLDFKTECERLLNQARPVLQEDMGLLKSMENFLKRIINAFVAFVTCCFTDQYQNGIFKSNLQIRADQLIVDLEQQLDDEEFASELFQIVR